MEDRFKFRVWCTCENEGYLSGAELENVLEINRELDGTDHFFISHEGAIETDYVFEQCTGLKDKNGKLVYEGDILRVFFYGDEVPEDSSVHRVVWGGEDYPAFDVVPLISDDCNSLALVQCEYRMAVIGNIHDNPELLEEQ